jgi:hypothetical protein
MSGQKYPSEWLDRVPAMVFASLAPGTLRIVLFPGSGMAQGGASRDIAAEIVARELRLPNTPLWAKLDEKLDVLEVWRRDE